MIVEFIGIAGCGKSTLAEMARQDFLARGLATLSLDECSERYVSAHSRLASLLRVLPAGPRAACFRTLFNRRYAPALQAAFREKHGEAWSCLQDELARVGRTRPGDLARTRALLEQRMGHHMLLDKIVPQQAVLFWGKDIAFQATHLFVSASEDVDAERLRSFLARLPFPGMIVQVEATPAACLRRILARGLPQRLEGSSEADILRFLENSNVLSEETAAEAERRGVPVLRLVNDYASPEELSRADGWRDMLRAVETQARVAAAAP